MAGPIGEQLRLLVSMHFGIDHHEPPHQIDHGLHEIPKSGSGHLSKIRERVGVSGVILRMTPQPTATG